MFDPPPLCFSLYSNIFTQPIPENSWPYKTFCCRCPYAKNTKKKLSPLRALWTMVLKTAHGLKIEIYVLPASVWPRCLAPFYIVTYYIIWVKTSCKYSMGWSGNWINEENIVIESFILNKLTEKNSRIQYPTFHKWD